MCIPRKRGDRNTLRYAPSIFARPCWFTGRELPAAAGFRHSGQRLSSSAMRQAANTSGSPTHGPPWQWQPCRQFAVRLRIPARWRSRDGIGGHADSMGGAHWAGATGRGRQLTLHHAIPVNQLRADRSANARLLPGSCTAKCGQSAIPKNRGRVPAAFRRTPPLPVCARAARGKKPDMRNV